MARDAIQNGQLGQIAFATWRFGGSGGDCPEHENLIETQCHGFDMLEINGLTGRLFNIGLTLRYSPHYRKIKQLLESGAVGDIISMEFNETLDFNHGGYIMGNWRRLREYAGTHLLEKCCHDIDLVNWMVGSRARHVSHELQCGHTGTQIDSV